MFGHTLCDKVFWHIRSVCDLSSVNFVNFFENPHKGPHLTLKCCLLSGPHSATGHSSSPYLGGPTSSIWKIKPLISRPNLQPCYREHSLKPPFYVGIFRSGLWIDTLGLFFRSACLNNGSPFRVCACTWALIGSVCVCVCVCVRGSRSQVSLACEPDCCCAGHSAAALIAVSLLCCWGCGEHGLC